MRSGTTGNQGSGPGGIGMPDIFGLYPVMFCSHLGIYHTVSSLSPVAGYINLLIVLASFPTFAMVSGVYFLVPLMLGVAMYYGLNYVPPKICMLKS